MFVRVKTTPNSPRKSIQICENVRVNGKVKQKILRYIGIAMNEREEGKLKDLANETMSIMLAERVNESQQQSLFFVDADDFKNKKSGRPKRKNLKDILPPEDVRLNEIIEECRIVEGVHDVAGIMFDELYASLSLNKKPLKILKDIVLARLESPASKHRTQKNLEKYFGKSHDLDAIYPKFGSRNPAGIKMKPVFI